MNQTETVDTEDTVLTPEIQQQIAAAIEPFEKALAKCNEEARQPIANDADEMAALVYIAQRKRDYTEMEEIRDRLVRPYNTIVKAINKAFKRYTDQYDADWRLKDQARSLYVTKKQQAIDAANRKAIADAEEARRIEEAKAETARQEAERLRLEAERIYREEVEREYQAEMARLAAENKKKAEAQAILDAQRAGDERAARIAEAALQATKDAEEKRLRQDEAARLAAMAEQDRVEKAAIKQDAKADIAESKATMVAPTIQVNDSVGSRTLVDGSKVGTREVDEWYFSNGLAVHTDLQKKKYAEYYADDARLPNGIPDRYWLLDLAKLGKDVKNGVPIEGCVKTTRSATTAGRK